MASAKAGVVWFIIDPIQNEQDASMHRLDVPAADWNLDQIVTELRASRELTHNIRHQGRIHKLPSRKALLGIVEGLCAALFPTHYGRADLNETTIDYFVGHTLNQPCPSCRIKSGEDWCSRPH